MNNGVKKIAIAVVVVAVTLTGFLVVHHMHGDGHSHEGGEHLSTSLSLNNGAKWMADDHTRQSMGRIGELLSSKDSLEKLADYQALANGIDAQMRGLISGCTMQGPAHDQLHVFLSMFIPGMEKLKNPEGIEEAKKIRAELVELVSVYHQHFS